MNKWVRGVIRIFVLIGCSFQVLAQDSGATDSSKIQIQQVLTKGDLPAYLKVKPIQNNYYQQLGAACKLEFNFEKATKVPLRLRLGSLQQTDYMEQKPNAIKPSK